jgi:hypothetical protein
MKKEELYDSIRGGRARGGDYRNFGKPCEIKHKVNLIRSGSIL